MSSAGMLAILMASALIPEAPARRPSSIPDAPPPPSEPPIAVQAAIVDRRTEKQKRRAARNLRAVAAGGFR